MTINVIKGLRLLYFIFISQTSALLLQFTGKLAVQNQSML